MCTLSGRDCKFSWLLSKELWRMKVFVKESIVWFFYALSATTVFVLLHLFFAWFVQYGLAVKLLQSEELVMTFLSLLDCATSSVCKISLFCNCAGIICRICHWLWWHQSKHLVALCLGCGQSITYGFRNTCMVQDKVWGLSRISQSTAPLYFLKGM
jgi:hypothetical protein